MATDAAQVVAFEPFPIMTVSSGSGFRITQMSDWWRKLSHVGGANDVYCRIDCPGKRTRVGRSRRLLSGWQNRNIAHYQTRQLRFSWIVDPDAQARCDGHARRNNHSRLRIRRTGYRFLKVDVQVAESQLLEGAEWALKSHRIRLMYLEWSRDAEVERRLEDAGHSIRFMSALVPT
ncbi:FkbM family methyltransferase [Mycolicibacterium tusciae]|uniref:FkbM family methyltransferase n=1 Tax=Mycolicibacterium tusciae TaxID=75922 RepID=UPI003C6E2771